MFNKPIIKKGPTHHDRKLFEALAKQDKEVRPIDLYDLRIELPERAEKRKKFPTLSQAADFLGVHRHKVLRAVGKRVKDKDGNEWAVRDAKK